MTRQDATFFGVVTLMIIRWRDVDCVWYSAEKDEWLTQQP